MIAVYGAGNVGISNVGFLKHLKYDIKDIVFCDGDEKKHNTYIQDICVLNFDEVKKIENVVFVISVVPNSEAYKEIELTLKEFNILKLMISSYPTVVSREKLIEKIWGYD